LQGLNTDLDTAEHQLLSDADRISRDARRYRRDANKVVGIAHRFADRDRFLSYGDKIRSHMRSIHRVRAPLELVFHLRSKRRWFRNHVYECHALADGVTTDTCPQGNRSPDQPDKRQIRREMRRASLTRRRGSDTQSNDHRKPRQTRSRRDEPPRYAGAGNDAWGM